MGITKKEAEKHLERLARRRALYAARKGAAAQTPREPVQLPLFATPEPRKPTAQEREAMEREAKNIGRSWIRKIRSILKED